MKQIMDKDTTCQDPKTLSWENITARVTVTKGKHALFSWCGGKAEETTKIILNKVSGIARAGSLLAIIGSSGSGKTTLLNCLTQRNIGSLKVEGRVLVNGENIGDEMRTVSGYVQQEDIFFPYLTVGEHLWFNAVLRLDKRVTDCQRQERIESMMKELGLKKCEHTAIGLPGSVTGISGGEKKRLAFGTELLTNPQIMVCDEPTSGLDSFTASSVVQALKNIALKGHTVLATIHQPSSELFALFDNIMIMAEGRIAFLGSRNDALKFFSGLGYRCPENYNASDFYIQTLALIQGQERECIEKITKICNYFDESIYMKAIKSQMRYEEDIGQDEFLKKENQIPLRRSQNKNYETTWLEQFKLCLWRQWKESMRNSKVITARIIQLSLLSLFVGSVFYQQDDTQKGVANINSGMFMVAMQLSFNVSCITIARMTRSLVLVVKEHHDRMYSVSAFYLADVLFEMLMANFVSLPYLLIVYFMIGLYPDVTTFFTIAASLILLIHFANALAHFCIAMFEPSIAVFIHTCLIGFGNFFNGLFVNTGSNSLVFNIFGVVSCINYGYEIMIISQWKNVKYLECDSIYANNKSGGLLDPIACFSNGMEVIDSFGYDIDDVGFCFWIMVTLLLATEVISYIILTFKVKRAK